MDKPIYSGTLYVLPIGWKQVLKKTWQEKYCLVYKASKSGIERLEIFDNPEHDSTPKIIPLKNCIKIEHKSATVFSVITKSNIHDFMATNEGSLQEWILTLQQVAFRDFNMEETASICEDNELYSPSADGPNEFRVTVHATEASSRCKLEGRAQYALVLTSSAIQLFKQDDTLTKDNRTLLFTWPYCYVRRYGHKDGKFTFEAGRKCESGEGTFLFDHGNQQEIFRCVSTKMKHMKKMLTESGNGMGVSPTECAVDKVNCCVENQLHVNLVKEAELPDMDSPSVNVTASRRQETINSAEQVIPKKPPRKSNALPSNSEHTGNHLNYETIERYDEVERRENAWRTLGTGDVRHSDRVNELTADTEPTPHNKSTRKPATHTPETSINNTKVIYSREIASDDNADNSYDHLSFFGSTSKLCPTPSNGYKQVVPVQVGNSTGHRECANDYDEVGVSAVKLGTNTAAVSQLMLEGVRLADDSHLGYAVVRKGVRIVVAREIENVPEHKVYNDNAYAVISKPKHV